MIHFYHCLGALEVVLLSLSRRLEVVLRLGALEVDIHHILLGTLKGIGLKLS